MEVVVVPVISEFVEQGMVSKSTCNKYISTMVGDTNTLVL